MNKILELKGNFTHSKNHSNGASISLPKASKQNPVKTSHMEKLLTQLKEIYKYWEKDTLINGALITVYYREIVAKSNRLEILLKEDNLDKNLNIRGAKFNFDITKHIFTYFISLKGLAKSIDLLTRAINVISHFYNNSADCDTLNNLNSTYVCKNILSKTNFAGIIKDCYYVEDFIINRDESDIEEASIVSIYKTGVPSQELFNKIGINLIADKMLDETTLLLNSDEFKLLKLKAPYLIAMKTIDISNYVLKDIEGKFDFKPTPIPEPKDEPIIGVIDTIFDTNVYFSKWVEYVEMVDEAIPREPQDYEHGTAVTSIIVDGPNINPNLDDGCGRFRVKHFGVACGGVFSSFSILKNIRRAIRENPQIKVWNLSLGSNKEIYQNYISPEAAELDKIQSEYDVIFVISGTNKPLGVKGKMKIGSPADSINSLVVNSVNFENKPASYHRVGPVLSFFYKPDVSYYGGDVGEEIRVCLGTGEAFVKGTSFAAPWISRKLAYLINVLGFNREVAKALIIDSAAGWKRKDTDKYDIGYGVVPINIKDILETKNDEIRFILSSATEDYETFNYNIPIPLDEVGKVPYVSRATLCYFPKCSRAQGVDYTNTEIDFKFGRVSSNIFNKTSLKDMCQNNQGEVGDYTIESRARNFWRKWDNVKHLSSNISNKLQAKKNYTGLCGVKMTVKGRLSSNHETIPFGIVITLKEINSINRVSEFIKNCTLKGWFVNQIDVDNIIKIRNKAEEEIKFE